MKIKKFNESINDDNYDEMLEKTQEEADIMLKKELIILWNKYKNMFKDFEEDEGQLLEDFVDYISNNVYHDIDGL